MLVALCPSCKYFSPHSDVVVVIGNSIVTKKIIIIA